MKRALMASSFVMVLASSAAAETPPWPPAIGTLFDGEACSALPQCSFDAPVGAQQEPFERGDPFTLVMRTRKSSCSGAVALRNPRAKEGAHIEERVGFRVRGDCIVSSKGKVIGAVRNGVLAMCNGEPKGLGSIAYQTVVLEVADGGIGRARVPVRNLPWLLTGQSECEIQLDLQLRAGEPSPELTAPDEPTGDVDVAAEG